MRIAHTSDLHIGKRLHEHSLLDDQEKILDEILEIIIREKVETLIIAGDVYDKSTPATEAVRLFDDFICKLKDRNIKLLCISGNHDSMERISYGSRIMSRQNMYFQENFNGRAQRITLSDEYGDLNVYMVPFIKPVYVGMTNYEEAFAKVIGDSDIDFSCRNILVAHQFVTPTAQGVEIEYDDLNNTDIMPLRCDSESVNVGGLDNISYEIMKSFDYVALGHLHRRQYIGEEHIRYSGSPLKYSFSESKDTKSIEIIDMGEKGNCAIKRVDLAMPRDLRMITGTMDELTSKDVVYAPEVSNEDYICAVITDEDRVTDAADRLLKWYPNLLNIIYKRDIKSDDSIEAISIKGKTPFELFSEYYELMNKKPMDDRQKDIIVDILRGESDET